MINKLMSFIYALANSFASGITSYYIVFLIIITLWIVELNFSRDPAPLGIYLYNLKAKGYIIF
jgi:hypothetical protein